jgi:hypothetical protein
MRSLTLLFLAALALSSCGDEAAAPSAGTDLRIEVQPEGPEGPTRTDRLRCPGDERCARLERAAFEPTPPDVACTEIYGGPGLARVTGTLDGERIDARFSRHNGCEIERWDRLQWLLGAAGAP